MASDFEGPNGLAFSPDESRRYVAGTGDPAREHPAQTIRVFDLLRDGLSLSRGGEFHKVDPGIADGSKVDDDGNLCASAGDGVHRIDPSGALLGKVLVPSKVAHLCFGDRYRSRLFIGASRTLYSIFLNRRGAALPSNVASAGSRSAF